MRRILFIIFTALLLLIPNVYAQNTADEEKPKDEYMMEDIKKYLTGEENNYFLSAQKQMEDFMANNKDLEDYLGSAVEGVLKGDKKSVEDMFAKLRQEIDDLIGQLNLLNPPETLKKYHKLNVEALNLLVKKLDPKTIADEAYQKKLDEQGEKIVSETNKEIEGLIKSRVQ